MSASLALLQDPFQVVSDFLESPILWISGQLVALLFVVLWLALVYWTFTDATRRGAIRLLWGLVAGGGQTSPAARRLPPAAYLLVRPTMSAKLRGSRLAPPTRAPSTSGWEMSSTMLSGLTLPP